MKQDEIFVKKTEYLNIKIEPSLKAALIRFAKKRGMPVSQVVRSLVKLGIQP